MVINTYYQERSVAQEYSIFGRIIDKDNSPYGGLKVEAFDSDPYLNPDDKLGTSKTDKEGFFQITFDQSSFAGFWEQLDGSPELYLIVRDSKGKKILTTKEHKTKKQIKYMIKVAPDHDKKPKAKTQTEIYAANPNRFLYILNNVGFLLNRENSINLDMIANAELGSFARQQIGQLTGNLEEAQSTFNQLMALVSGVINSYASQQDTSIIPAGSGHDGPQVPQNPWKTAHNDVIAWPRSE